VSIPRVAAVARKEWIQVRRDPLSLALAFLLPVILLIIYGYAVTFDINNVTLVIYDNDRSSTSRSLIEQFVSSGYFSVTAYVESYDQIDVALDTRSARAALIIPERFQKEVNAGRETAVEVVIDGTDANTASIVQGYTSAVARQFTGRLSRIAIKPLIDLRSRVWYNPDLKSRNFIIPGLIAIIMAVIVSLLTSLTIAREWERGTMEQLIATPLKSYELIIGKLLPYFLIGFADTIISLLMSTFLFGVPLRGSLFLVLLSSGIFLFGGLSFGILISVVGRNQLKASMIALLSSFLPAFLLSGFIFNITNMPAPLQAFTYIIPARYFVTILKGLFLKGVGFSVLMTEFLLLSLYALAVFVIANKRFKKRID
jgi:ABC-2 type transport system permease protein